MAQQKKAQSSKKKTAKTAEKPKSPKWTYETFGHTFWLKIYPEMCKGFSIGMTHEEMRDLLRDTLMPLMFVDFDLWHIHGIVHYKDYAKNDIIAPSCEKPHAHIALQKQGTNIRIGTLFNWLENLCDITVRPEDLPMLQNGGLIIADRRSADNGRFRSWMVYHTHETYEAQETDGKALYDRSECVTNFPPEELQKVYDIYFDSEEARKVDDKYIAKLYDKYFAEGFAHQRDFDEIYNESTPLLRIRIDKYKKLLAEQYDRGALTYIDTEDALKHEKTVIYIYGEHNLGKTTTSCLALQSLGYKYYRVNGGGSGRMEGLQVSHNAIVFSDTSVPEILTTCEDGANVFQCRYHNRYFFGDIIIITSNQSIVKWYDDKYRDYGVDYQAFRSRILSFKATSDGSLLVDSDNSQYYRRGDYRAKIRTAKAFCKAYEHCRKNYLATMQNANTAQSDSFDDLFADDEYFSSRINEDCDKPITARGLSVSDNEDGSLQVGIPF